MKNIQPVNPIVYLDDGSNYPPTPELLLVLGAIIGIALIFLLLKFALAHFE